MRVTRGDAEWNDDANALLEPAESGGRGGRVTRRRRKKLCASNGVDHVWEPMTVPGVDVPGDEESAPPGTVPGDVGTARSPSRHLRYKQVEGAFSNPNGDAAEVTAAGYTTCAKTSCSHATRRVQGKG